MVFYTPGTEECFGLDIRLGVSPRCQGTGTQSPLLTADGLKGGLKPVVGPEGGAGYIGMSGQVGACD